MELVIGLIILAVVGYFVFFHKKPEEAFTTSVEVAPTPTATEVVNSQPVVAESTPVVETAPAKKPRAPRKPKAETVKKPAAKKPAAKKPAAKKTTTARKKA